MDASPMCWVSGCNGLGYAGYGFCSWHFEKFQAACHDGVGDSAQIVARFKAECEPQSPMRGSWATRELGTKMKPLILQHPHKKRLPELPPPASKPWEYENIRGEAELAELAELAATAGGQS